MRRAEIAREARHGNFGRWFPSFLLQDGTTTTTMSSHAKAAAPRVKGKVTFKARNSAPVASGSGSKRKRPSPTPDEEDDEASEDEDDLDEEADVESEADTDDEIAAAQAGKSKKTASECGWTCDAHTLADWHCRTQKESDIAQHVWNRAGRLAGYRRWRDGGRSAKTECEPAERTVHHSLPRATRTTVCAVLPTECKGVQVGH